MISVRKEERKGREKWKTGGRIEAERKVRKQRNSLFHPSSNL